MVAQPINALSPDSRAGSGINSPRLVERFDYPRADGSPGYRVLRYEPKDFKQQHWDGHSWQWGLGPFKDEPLPYDLPNVRRAVALGLLIFITEGERKGNRLAAALRSAGIDAAVTCNNGGAGHWGEAQSRHMAGTRIILLPDNDSAGRKHVAKAARCLQAAGAAQIKIVELPGLDTAEDIDDWLQAGHTVDELLALVASTLDYVPPAEPERPAHRPSASRRVIAPDDRPGLTAWAARALENITAEVANSLPGEHFAVLKARANRLGTIAAHGLLTESECIQALEGACEQNGYSAKNGGQQAARKRIEFYFRSGLAHPEDCELPPRERLFRRSENGARSIDSNGLAGEPLSASGHAISNNPGWQATLHRSLERSFFEYLPKTGKTFATLLRAILESFGAEPFTRSDLKTQGGLSDDRIDRMATYGFDDIFLVEESAPAEIYRRMISIGTNQDQRDSDPVETPIDHSAEKCTSTGSKGRPPVRYRLRPRPEAKQRYLDRIVWPRLVEKYLKTVDGLLARPSAELLQALSARPDQAVIDAYTAALDEKLSEKQKQAIQAAYDRATLDYKRISRQLDDLTCEALPDTPDGKGWRQDYVGAVATRNMHACQGKPSQSWREARQQTGLSLATLRRTEHRIGITRDENWHKHHVEVAVVEALPDPVYDPHYEGFPAEATFEDGSVLNYHDAGVRKRAEHEVKAGGKVWIKYRRANKAPRLMTPEEREAARTAEAERKSRKPTGGTDEQKCKGTPKQAGAIDPPFCGIGHRPAYALGWAKAMDDLLGPIKVGGRYMLLSRPVTVFERYGLPTGQPIPIEQLYARLIDAHHYGADGGTLWNALPDDVRTTVRRYAGDGIDPCVVVIKENVQ